MGLIARDLATGMSRLTQTITIYCQLPADRNSLSAFSLPNHIAHELSMMRQTTPPDYLVVDPSSSRTCAFDKYSPISNNPLSRSAEKPLPAVFNLKTLDGSDAAYEVVSFCNLERSAITPVPTRWSRMKSFSQQAALWEKGSFCAFPQRHMTAVVHYGQEWFVADDTRIWRAQANGHSPEETGQALLTQYPGMRTIIFYKRVALGSDNESEKAVDPALQLDVTLTKISPYRNTSWTERPATAAIAIMAPQGYLSPFQPPCT